MIERALILAAGRGVRMGPRGRDIPKGFIEVGGHALIVRSLELLAAAGIREAVIVTGHLAQCYDGLPKIDGLAVSLVHNPHFADMGSFESLRVGIGEMRSPFLLLESDIIYESRALQAALAADDENLILTSGPTGAGDEVYVWADERARSAAFRSMSKVKSAHADEPFGELVGILKLSEELARHLALHAADILPNGDYESALVLAARHVPISCIRVDDLLWGEIDDETMLANVEARLWPALRKAR